jgi:hypothetical protein
MFAIDDEAKNFRGFKRSCAIDESLHRVITALTPADCPPHFHNVTRQNCGSTVSFCWPAPISIAPSLFWTMHGLTMSAKAWIAAERTSGVL